MSPSSAVLDALELTGRSRSHVVQYDSPRFAARRDAAAAFLAMREAACQAGFDLVPVSAFRDFNAQVKIWNDKFSGRRPLYGMDGRPREHSTLGADEIIAGILAWSALPGASRHHWGTDFDVIDAAAVPADYRFQLLPQEFSVNGPFNPLRRWLDANIATYGFFRPYDRYRGGLFPEPWHLSYAPAADAALKHLTPELLSTVLADAGLLGKDRILDRIPSLHQDYVLNIATPDPRCLRPIFSGPAAGRHIACYR